MLGWSVRVVVSCVVVTGVTCRGLGEEDAKGVRMVVLSRKTFVAAIGAGCRYQGCDPGGGLRFAFYGRMSTSEFQDAVTSRAWQRAVSDELVDGIGHVVVEFFDVGCSRRWGVGGPSDGVGVAGGCGGAQSCV